MYGQQRWNAAALRIHAPYQVAGPLGRNHDHVDVFRGLDGLEMNGEAVRETEYLSFAQMWPDGRLVEGSLRLIGRENLDPVGALRGLGGGDDDHSVRPRLLGRNHARDQVR